MPDALSLLLFQCVWFKTLFYMYCPFVFLRRNWPTDWQEKEKARSTRQGSEVFRRGIWICKEQKIAHVWCPSHLLPTPPTPSFLPSLSAPPPSPLPEYLFLFCFIFQETRNACWKWMFSMTNWSLLHLCEKTLNKKDFFFLIMNILKLWYRRPHLANT